MAQVGKTPFCTCFRRKTTKTFYHPHFRLAWACLGKFSHRALCCCACPEPVLVNSPIVLPAAALGLSLSWKFFLACHVMSEVRRLGSERERATTTKFSPGRKAFRLPLQLLQIRRPAAARGSRRPTTCSMARSDEFDPFSQPGYNFCSSFLLIALQGSLPPPRQHRYLCTYCWVERAPRPNRSNRGGT